MYISVEYIRIDCINVDFIFLNYILTDTEKYTSEFIVFLVIGKSHIDPYNNIICVVILKPRWIYRSRSVFISGG